MILFVDVLLIAFLMILHVDVFFVVVNLIVLQQRSDIGCVRIPHVQAKANKLYNALVGSSVSNIYGKKLSMVLVTEPNETLPFSETFNGLQIYNDKFKMFNANITNQANC